MGIRPITSTWVDKMPEPGPESGDSPVKEVEKDKRSAYMGWDALEWSIVEAVKWDEMEVAAEYAEALFLEQSQLPAWAGEYHETMREMASEDISVGREQHAIGWAMEELEEWADEHDHDVSEWFEQIDDGSRAAAEIEMAQKLDETGVGPETMKSAAWLQAFNLFGKIGDPEWVGKVLREATGGGVQSQPEAEPSKEPSGSKD